MYKPYRTLVDLYCFNPSIDPKTGNGSLVTKIPKGTTVQGIELPGPPRMVTISYNGCYITVGLTSLSPLFNNPNDPQGPGNGIKIVTPGADLS